MAASAFADVVVIKVFLPSSSVVAALALYEAKREHDTVKKQNQSHRHRPRPVLA